MQFYLSLGELLQFQPAPKLDDSLRISSEAFHIILTLGLLWQVIKHKLIEIIHQILRQMRLSPQILFNLIKVPIQHPHSLPLPSIFQLLTVPLHNPSKTLSLITHLFPLSTIYIFCLRFYKICYIFLIIVDLSTAITVRFLSGQTAIVFVLDMQVQRRKSKVFLAAFARVNLLGLGEFAGSRG